MAVCPCSPLSKHPQRAQQATLAPTDHQCETLQALQRAMDNCPSPFVTLPLLHPYRMRHDREWTNNTFTMRNSEVANSTIHSWVPTTFQSCQSLFMGAVSATKRLSCGKYRPQQVAWRGRHPMAREYL